MSNTLQTQTAIPKSVKSWLTGDYFRQQISLTLPKHLSAERFCRIALTALIRTPKLQDCTPESVVNCCLNLSALGLEPDGRRAHLIPYGKDCTLIVDYKGLVELAKRSGEIGSIHADVVCENDVFDYDTGVVKQHRIDFRKPRGPMYAAYCIIKFKDADADPKCEVMTKDEIDGIRKRSRAGQNGPWVSDFNEMAKKTVFRRASKWITLSPEVEDALHKDGDSLPAGTLVAEPPAIDITPNPTPALTDADHAEMGRQEAEFERNVSGAGKPKGRPPGSKNKLSMVEPAHGDAPEVPPALAAQIERGEGVFAMSPQDQLENIVCSAGYSFDNFKKFCEEMGTLEGVDSMTGFADVPDARAASLAKAHVGLLSGIERVTGVARQGVK